MSTCMSDHHKAARAIDIALADYVFAAGHLARGLEEFDEDWQNLKTVNGHFLNEMTGGEPFFNNGDNDERGQKTEKTKTSLVSPNN